MSDLFGEKYKQCEKCFHFSSISGNTEDRCNYYDEEVWNVFHLSKDKCYKPKEDKVS